ncbi:MAG: Ig-like domain-containing protein [Vicinamibacterales bacterium]
MNISDVRRRCRSISLCAAAALALAVLATGCNNPMSASHLLVISVTGSAPPAGGQAQFAAVAIFNDDTTQDITQTATWQSSDTSIATVNPTGLVTALAPGVATIKATFDNTTGSTTVTVQ